MVEVKSAPIETNMAAMVMLNPNLSLRMGSSAAINPGYMSLIKCPMERAATRPFCMGSLGLANGLCLFKLLLSQTCENDDDTDDNKDDRQNIIILKPHGVFQKV